MGTYILRKGHSRLADLADGATLGLGVGNVYYVCKTTDTAVHNWLLENKQCYYKDGSLAVHANAVASTAIQSALDATVECRNDYVIVMPSDSDYDLTAQLTLTKKSVHLIGASGYYSTGCNNAVRLHQTGAYPIMTLTDAAIEVAGFYLKNYATKGGIILGAGTYGTHIHHNYFAMNLDGATNEPLVGPLIASTGVDYGAWGSIEYNFFQSQAGGSATIASIIRIEAPATGARICNNVIQIGDTSNTATVGINNMATKGIVSDNDFYAAQTASGAGVFTHCVYVSVDGGCAYGNRANVADGAIVAGGVDELAFVDNMNSVAGGTVDEL